MNSLSALELLPPKGAMLPVHPKKKRKKRKMQLFVWCITLHNCFVSLYIPFASALVWCPSVYCTSELVTTVTGCFCLDVLARRYNTVLYMSISCCQAIFSQFCPCFRLTFIVYRVWVHVLLLIRFASWDWNSKLCGFFVTKHILILMPDKDT